MAIPILLRASLTAFIIFFINFYVIAVKNAGFGLGAVTANEPRPWVWLFNYGQNRIPFAVLSFVLPLLIFSLWRQIRTHGVKKTFHRLFQFFHWTGYCISHAGRHTVPAIFLSAALLLPLALFKRNEGLYVSLLLMFLFAYVAQNETLSFLFVRAGWMDLQRLSGKKKRLQELNVGVGGLIPLGLMIGSILLLVLPKGVHIAWPIVLFLFLMAGGIFFIFKGNTGKAVALVLFFLGVQLIWLRYTGTVFADDAGFDELGNNLGNYIRDPGGKMVLNGGILPSGAGAAAAVIGSVPEFLPADGFTPRDVPVAGEASLAGEGAHSEQDSTSQSPMEGDGLIFVPEWGSPEELPMTHFEGDNPCR